MTILRNTVAIAACLALIVLVPSAIADSGVSTRGTVLTVDSLADAANADDDNPGDGICDNGAGACTLRAAIQEANAAIGFNTIDFSVSGTILVGNHLAGTRLPAITTQLSIDGPIDDSDGRPRPQVVIDGTQLSGTDNVPGIRFASGGNNGEVKGVSIVNFSGEGVLIDAGVDDILVDGCFIGVEPDGSAAGNDGHGISGITNESVFGMEVFSGALQRRGNVIGNNGGAGIFVAGSNNEIAGNLIGVGPDGVSNAGNTGKGITTGGAGNRIGLGEYEDAENVIAGNGDTGLEIGGSGAIVAGNRIGIDRNGGAEGNSGAGIRVFGDGHIIGTLEAHGRNDIANNTVGVSLGATSTPADNVIIQNNELGFGSGPLAQGNTGSGVNVLTGSGIEIIGNLIINNGAHGIRINSGGTDIVVQGNDIGFVETILGVNNQRNDLFGILNEGFALIGGEGDGEGNVIGFNRDGIVLEEGQADVYGNYIGVTPSGEAIGNVFDGVFVNLDSEFNSIGSPDGPNVIGNQFEYGVRILSNGNHVLDNFIGVDADGADQGNALAGVRMSTSASNNFIARNTIANNLDDGVEVLGFSTSNNILENSMYANAGIAIDLGPVGLDANDPDDADTGPNLMMNHPEITVVDWNEALTQLEIEVFVDTAEANATHPLRVDFYLDEREDLEQGRIYIDGRVYQPAQSTQTFTLDFPPDATGGALRATATDESGAGSTSELSPETLFGEFPDILFQDRFEEP